MTSSTSILLVAGEASGDSHGGRLVEEYRALDPSVRFWGMGGNKLAAAGMEITFDARHTAGVNGFTEVLGKIRGLLKTKREILARCDRKRPTAAVLIDFPDFNLRLARELHARGIKIFYFIAPQVWAWREGRVQILRETVTELASIIPFEPAYFQKHGISAHYVGHPFLDRPPVTTTRAALCESIGIDSSHPLVALLPGSRHSEVRAHLPPLLEAIETLRREGNAVEGVIPVPETLDPGEVQAMVTQLAPGKQGITVIAGKARELLSAADAAIVKSGTSTIDATIAGVPFCVIYKISPLSYLIARTLVRGVSFVAMTNLIAGRPVVREILQSAVTGSRLAQELRELLTDQKLRSAIRSDLQAVTDNLREGLPNGGTAGARAARLLDQMIRNSPGSALEA